MIYVIYKRNIISKYVPKYQHLCPKFTQNKKWRDNIDFENATYVLHHLHMLQLFTYVITDVQIIVHLWSHMYKHF